MPHSSPIAKDDPRQLRLLFERAAFLSRVHKVPCVFVGVAGERAAVVVGDGEGRRARGAAVGVGGCGHTQVINEPAAAVIPRRAATAAGRPGPGQCR